MALASLAALIAAASLLAAPPTSTPEPSTREPAPSPDSGRAEGPQPEPKGETADTRSRAKQAFDVGLDAVSKGEFEVAVQAFERAYELRPHPVTLFNLALALEKAERQPEAWELFEAVLDIVESDAERREVRRHMRAIEMEIAIIEVAATPERRLCLNEVDMPATATGSYRLAVETGRHVLMLDDQEIKIDLAAGDRRVLLLQDSDDVVDGRRRGPLVPAMLGTSIGSGALALGLGLGAAAAREPRNRAGLGVSAATGAGVAAIAAVIALLVDREVIKERREDPNEDFASCPRAPVDSDRIDLRLAPAIERPAQFVERPDWTPSMPVPEVDRARDEPDLRRAQRRDSKASADSEPRPATAEARRELEAQRL